MEPEPTIGKGVRFERIRRITGYLVGSLDRFNNAKQAEVRDRLKHASMEPYSAPQNSASAAFITFI